jgi:hypothetical protein
VKVSDLPGPEALYEPGRKDGQTKVGGRTTGVRIIDGNAKLAKSKKIDL